MANYGPNWEEKYKKAVEGTKRYQKKNPDKVKKYKFISRLRKYGLTEAEYNQILADQHGVCKICGQPELTKRLSVDHDHRTGKVRGLLCTRCNTMIGYAKDDPEVLQAGVEYLKENE